MLQAGRIASLSAALALVLIFPGVAAADDRNGDTIVVITGGATVAEGESVDGVLVVSGDTEISGEVTGDVTVIAEPAVIGSSARIGGDLRYGDEKPEIASGAQIDGEVSDEGWSDLRPAGWIGWAGWAVFWFALALSSLALGLLLLLIAPRAADSAYRQAREGAWESAAAGLAIFILL